MGPDGSRAYYEDIMVEAPAFLQEGTIETTGGIDIPGLDEYNVAIWSLPGAAVR